MQLQNTPIPQNAIPFARETLAISDAAHGLQGMTPPNTGMYNLDDSGAMSKPNMNAQLAENAMLDMQNLRQNAITATPQQIAGATDALRAQEVEIEQKAFKAQQLMSEYASNELEKRGGGQGLMALNAVMQSPDREAFINDIATSKAMFAGEAPELGAYTASANRYRA